MIQIIVTDEHRVDPDVDELHRDRCGYTPSMSQLAMYDANRGTWTVGAQAEHERFVIFVHRGVGVQAIEINAITRTPRGKAVFDGAILEAGHPVYDAHVGKPAPKPNMRNPVTYVRSPFDKGMPCQCGCGEFAASGKPFVQGHDQTALHDRVRQIGTVAEFLRWFDNLAAPLVPMRADSPRLALVGARNPLPVDLQV